MIKVIKDRGLGIRQGGGYCPAMGEDRAEAVNKIRITAVKTKARTVVQKGSRTIEDDGKAKRKLAPGCPIF